MDTLLSSLEDNQDTTQRELTGLVGRSKTTVNTYLQELAEAGHLERTKSGQYVIANHNGHEPDTAF